MILTLCAAPVLATSAGPQIVSFDWNSAELTAERRELLIRQVGGPIRQHFAGGGTIRAIIIQGHADRSGSDERSMELSLERARTVWRELRRNGLLVAATHIEAYGEQRGLREIGRHPGTCQ